MRARRFCCICVNFAFAVVHVHTSTNAHDVHVFLIIYTFSQFNVQIV